MPFDASGNFTRVYNFVQDAANGIKILAARVDGEFDNIATGMNAVFFRDGRVPMQADLRMNINGISGLKDGALGSPAIKFNTDPNTGVYLPGLNQYGVMVNSIQRGVFTTAGFDVTGNVTATGTISQGGSQVATQAFVTGAYAPLASPSLTGVPTAPTPPTATNSAQIATTAMVQAHSMPLAGGAFTGGVTGSTAFFSGALTGSPVNVNGTAGTVRSLNFQSAGTGVADISLQTDNVTIGYNAPTTHIFKVGGAQTLVVGASGACYVSNKLLLQHDGTNGYVRTQAAGGNLYLGTNGNNWVVIGSDGALTTGGTVNTGTLNASGPVTAAGAINATGASASLTSNNQAGSGYWSAYNFNNVFNLYFSSTNGVKFSVSDTGNVTTAGNVSSNGARLPNATVSAAAPSGGQNGDLWFQL